MRLRKLQPWCQRNLVNPRVPEAAPASYASCPGNATCHPSDVGSDPQANSATPPTLIQVRAVILGWVASQLGWTSSSQERFGADVEASNA